MAGMKRESDLYAPVRDYLLKRGHEIHVEMFDADIVTVCDGALWAIELKPCLTDTLWRQLQARERWADYVVAVIASDTRKDLGSFRLYGYGLWQVIDGKVRKRVGPKPQPWHWRKRRDYRIKRLSNRAPAMDHERAGLPASRELREQRQLRAEGGHTDV